MANFKQSTKTIRSLKQVGKTNLKRDITRKALTPGKRISKQGTVYWETRKNRSDALNSRI